MQDKKTKFKITKVEKIDELIKTSEEREKILKKYLFVALLLFIDEAIHEFIHKELTTDNITIMIVQSLLAIVSIVISCYGSFEVIAGFFNGNISKLIEVLSTDLKEMIDTNNIKLDNNAELLNKNSEVPETSFAESDDMTDSIENGRRIR